MSTRLNLIDSIIGDLELDLSGKTVLTEGATGAYAVTAVIAAEAGAEVYALARESRYGSIQDIRSNINELSGARTQNIRVIDQVTEEIIGKADIITNSGHLRPLNAEKLKFAKQGVVIPLMYEAWEYRKEDIDLDFCNRRSIPVAGTNERHPDIGVFDYLGEMCIKMIHDSGHCLVRNKFILLCNNPFGPYLAKSLVGLCDTLGVIDLAENKHLYEGLGVQWVGNFNNFEIPDSFDTASLIFTAYPFDKQWIGFNKVIDLNKIISKIKDPILFRFAGDIGEECQKHINCYPKDVPSGHMGILPSSLGFDPIARLQAGGLKVGECLLKKQWEFKSVELCQLMTPQN